MKALSIGGMQDHVHVFLSLPSTLPVAKAVQLIKGGSSKWVHDTFVGLGKFAWQEGYGAFSVNVSLLEDTIRYIEGQGEHHKRKTFQEEYIEFLRRNGIDYDERYVGGRIQSSRWDCCIIFFLPSDESLGYCDVCPSGALD
jgi:hypothetical protein